MAVLVYQPPLPGEDPRRNDDFLSRSKAPTPRTHQDRAAGPTLLALPLLARRPAVLDGLTTRRGTMKLKIATLVGVLALVASSAFAGGMQWVAVKGGAALPSSDLSDVAGTGFNVGGEYGYS